VTRVDRDDGVPETVHDGRGGTVDGAVEVSAAEHSRSELAALGRLSYYLDDLFVVPGTSYRVGLDPLLGLVPGVGDVATSTASAYIVARAAALGVPRATLARMLVILVVDAVFGSLPLVGDVFDGAWKANRRNVRLLESRLADPEGEARDRRYVLVVTVGLTLLLVLVSVGVAVAAWWLLGRAGVV
jgi:hypothetical protein